MSSDRVNQDRFTLFGGLLDEVKDALCCFVMAVEEYLVFLVKPKEGKINDPDILPVISYLLAGAIDNMGYFVCHHELQVLDTNNTLKTDANLPGLRTHRR